MWVTGNSNNYGLWSDADYDAVMQVHHRRSVHRSRGPLGSHV